MTEEGTAIVAAEKERWNNLFALKERAHAIVVIDPDSYKTACEIAVEARNYIKRVGFELDPGIALAKETLDHLKDQKAKFVDPAKAIAETASRKAEYWRVEEKRRAEAEAERLRQQALLEAKRKADEERRAVVARIAEEARKKKALITEALQSGEIKTREAERLRKEAQEAADFQRELAREQAKITAANVAPVEVAPSIPKVAGIKGRTNWKFRIIDESRIPRMYLIPDEVNIGAMVRSMKDPAKAEAMCPGIEVYSEESV